MATLSYTALISPADVFSASMGTLPDSLKAEIDAASGDLYDAAVRACHAATEAVETYLVRRLIVRARTMRFASAEWTTRDGFEATDETLLRVTRAPLWPVVEVTSVNAAAGDADQITLHAGELEPGYWMSYDPAGDLDRAPTYLEAFVGYRRSTQDLAALQGTDPGEGSLATLTVLPAALPELIVDVAATIAVIRTRQHMQSLVGVSRTTSQVGRLNVTAETQLMQDRQAAGRELQRLHGYRAYA